MANWVKVTKDSTNETVFVNLDEARTIQRIEGSPNNFTEILFGKDHRLLVVESPDELLTVPGRR